MVGTAGFVSQTVAVLLLWVYSVHCRVFSRTPGFYPWRPITSPQLRQPNGLQILPKVPWGKHGPPELETKRARQGNCWEGGGSDRQSEASWVQVEDCLWARPQAEHVLDGGRSWVRTNGFLVGSAGSRAVSLGVGVGGQACLLSLLSQGLY